MTQVLAAMKPSRKPSFRKNICPLCGGTSVVRNDKVMGFLSPKFSCPDCGAGLTTTATWRVLWGLVVIAAGLPATVFLVRWLQGSFELHRMLVVGIYAGFAGAIYACALKLTLEGLVFRPWRPGRF